MFNNNNCLHLHVLRRAELGTRWRRRRGETKVVGGGEKCFEDFCLPLKRNETKKEKFSSKVSRAEEKWVFRVCLMRENRGGELKCYLIVGRIRGTCNARMSDRGGDSRARCLEGRLWVLSWLRWCFGGKVLGSVKGRVGVNWEFCHLKISRNRGFERDSATNPWRTSQTHQFLAKPH